MGKKQHQKDKLYLTCTEWSTLYGGKSANNKKKRDYKRLPYNCCSISLQPFVNPYCTKEGIIFDLENILPFLKKHKINPVSGLKLKSGDLIKLNFHKNSSGKYHCPVTFKVFNENTHIVAIRPSGNVYCFDAIERLNFKTNDMRDLLTNELFIKEDIIEIQDPTNLEKFNINAFYHVKNAETKSDASIQSTIRLPNPETRETLTTLSKTNLEIPDYMTTNKQLNEFNKLNSASQVRDSFNTAEYSTHAAAHSLTSTVMVPTTKVEAAILSDDLVRYRYVKKKGYVRLITSHGNLNLELFCDIVPKTCENFIKLCTSGYYNDTEFHRLIRHFIIQGGDPTGSGMGGDSCWGGPFEDEFKPQFSHSGRGMLSMANSGPNTNKSQLTCKHLDKKHTIFGKVVGGLDTLDKVERIPTDDQDKPLEQIKLLATQVFVDPFQEADEILLKEREELKAKEEASRGSNLEADRFVMVNGIPFEMKPGTRKEEEALEASKRMKSMEAPSNSIETERVGGVGKFISNQFINSPLEANSKKSKLIDENDTLMENETLKKKRKLVLKTRLNDFSSW